MNTPRSPESAEKTIGAQSEVQESELTPFPEEFAVMVRNILHPEEGTSDEQPSNEFITASGLRLPLQQRDAA